MRFRLKAISILLSALLFILILSLGSVVSASETEQRAQYSAPIMIVNTSFLNVRTGPGVQYSILLTAVGGTTYPVLGVASDLVWYQVSTNAGPGWVNSQYVIPRGDFSNVPFMEAPPLVTSVSARVEFSGEVNNTDDTAVDMGFANQRPWGISVYIDHPLRAEPTIHSAELLYAPVDATVIYPVLGAQFNEGIQWIKTEVEGLPGWFEESKLKFRPFACELTAVELTQDRNLGIGPDGSGSTDVYVSGGQEAYLLDRVDDLYKIELISGNVGWVDGSAVVVRNENVRSDYCDAGGTDMPHSGAQGGIGDEGTTANVAIPRVIVNTGFLNIRSGPGAQYTTVATVPGGTELAVIGFANDGVWYLVSGDFGEGWLNSEFTLFRGDGSTVPVISNAVGEIAQPKAVVDTGTYTLYVAPDLTLGRAGTITGPVEVDIVARTSDFNWVQIRFTDAGFGWIQAEFVTLEGDLAQIPVVSN